MWERLRSGVEEVVIELGEVGCRDGTGVEWGWKILLNEGYQVLCVCVRIVEGAGDSVEFDQSGVDFWIRGGNRASGEKAL